MSGYAVCWRAAAGELGVLPDMTGANEPPAAPEKPLAGIASATAIRRYAVAALMQGAREAILDHDGAEYRLRITANGKLILTK